MLPDTQTLNTGNHVRALREELGISQQKLAEVLRVSVRTIARWEGGTEPDPDLRKRMTKLRRWVVDELNEHRDPELVLSWLQTPKERVVTCTPVDLLTIQNVQAKPA
jgi:transcriptional regulator with XRE-family HTH domain